MVKFDRVRIWVLVFVMLARLGQRTGECLVLLLGLKSEMGLFLVLWQGPLL